MGKLYVGIIDKKHSSKTFRCRVVVVVVVIDKGRTKKMRVSERERERKILEADAGAYNDIPLLSFATVDYAASSHLFLPVFSSTHHTNKKHSLFHSITALCSTYRAQAADYVE